MSDEGLMSPEQAEQAIWAFFWQVLHSRDRRQPMSPEEIAASMEERAVARTQLEIGLAGKIQRALARVFSARGQEANAEAATKDALAELEATEKNRTGKVNQATGLPENVVDLATGRGVVTGEDLVMDMLVPPYALAAASVAWLPPGADPSRDESWQVMAYKPVRRICGRCDGKGRRPGDRCKECNGKGRRKIGGFLSTNFEMCGACQGHGQRVGPICDDCGGKRTVENWTDEEHQTVRANARMISQQVNRLAEEGLFDPRPVDKNDVEMGSLTWEDKSGNTLGFKLTWKGLKYMREYIEKRPELKRSMHALAHAGDDVRAQAPQWARDEYEASSR